MSSDFGNLVELCISQARQLEDFVRRLPQPAWKSQSACNEWQVGDVVAHLSGLSYVFGRLITRMVKEEEEAEPQQQQDEEQLLTAEGAKKLHKELGEGWLLLRFTKDLLQFIQVIQTLQPEDAARTSAAAMGMGGRINVQQLLRVMAREMVVHRWDIESRVGAKASLPREAFPTLMGNLAGWRTFGFQKTEAQPPVRYHWVISETPPVTWDVVIKGDSFEQHSSATGSPDVIFSTDPETYLLVGFGRQDLRDAIDRDLIQAKGDQAKIDAYSTYFQPL